mgnify:CR=1 FL=1
MKFTKATKENSLTITIQSGTLYVRYCLDHPKDEEIRAGIKAAGYNLAAYNLPNEKIGYTVKGGTPAELEKVKEELTIEYDLVESVEDVALLSRIAIEIAIGAAIADRRRQRLTTENFPPGFDAIKASQTDGFMAVCVETARSILMLLE